MAKSQSTSRSQPRIPAGHFDRDGVSQGKQTGPVRKTPDACNEKGKRNAK